MESKTSSRCIELHLHASEACFKPRRAFSPKQLVGQSAARATEVETIGSKYNSIYIRAGITFISFSSPLRNSWRIHVIIILLVIPQPLYSLRKS